MSPTVEGPEADLVDLVADLELVDHHCHSIVGHDLDGAAFERLVGESHQAPPPGCSNLDTSLGLAIRAWCAPRLDLPAGVDVPTYLDRRRELGPAQVAMRLLAGGSRRFLVDTGYRSDELVDPQRLAGWAGGTVHEVARLETVGEDVMATLAGSGGATAYADRFAAEIEGHRGAAGWKSVAAYRGGLDLDWSRPSPGEVAAAAGEWLAAGPAVGTHGPAWRMEHPVLIRHGVWTAVDTGRPLQFHTGFGDTDVRLPDVDPALLSDLLAATADQGTPIMLLHGWPYHRHAGYLAQVWPHVYLDVGQALPHVGHHGPTVLAEALELAPWHKVLYSSDAFGLAELYHLGVVTHRRALVAALRPLETLGFDRAELTRLAGLVTSGNARRVYPGLVTPS